MNCHDIQETLELYALGIAEPSDKSEIERHLSAGCTACEEQLQAARATNAMFLSQAESHNPPARLKRRIMASVGVQKSSWSWLGALSTAAMMGVALWLGNQERTRTNELADARLLIQQAESQRDRLSLAIAMLSKDKLTPYADFINKDLWRHAIAAQPKLGAEHQQYEQVYRDLRNYIKDPSMGAGIERCVYELNEWQPCMSPLIESQYIMEVKGILPALDVASKTANNKLWPVDRHVAAFLRARYAKGTGSQIDAMNDPRPDRATIGMLSVLAIVQWRLGPEALHGLASWVGGLMNPVINSYMNRNKRRELEKELPKLVRKGNLAELYNYRMVESAVVFKVIFNLKKDTFYDTVINVGSLGVVYPHHIWSQF